MPGNPNEELSSEEQQELDSTTTPPGDTWRSFFIHAGAWLIFGIAIISIIVYANDSITSCYIWDNDTITTLRDLEPGRYTCVTCGYGEIIPENASKACTGVAISRKYGKNMTVEENFLRDNVIYKVGRTLTFGVLEGK